MNIEPIITFCPICGTRMDTKIEVKDGQYTLTLSCPAGHMVGNKWKGVNLADLYESAADFYAAAYQRKPINRQKPKTNKLSEIGGNDHGHSKNAAMTRAAYFKARRVG